MDGTYTTHKNNGNEIGARKFDGQFFGFATYMDKATEIQGTKAEFATLASAMSDGDLNAALLQVKSVARRLEDPETVLVAEMKARMDKGATFESFYLDSYDRAGPVDWVAIGAALGMTKTAARAKFAGTVPTKALKPKA